MRIASRAQLIEMPVGTVFTPCVPQVAEGLFIFGGKCGPDFLEECLIGVQGSGSSEHESRLWDKMIAGESIDVEYGVYGREGSFDDKQLYLVYEQADVRKLIAALHRAYMDGYHEGAEK